MIEKVYLELHKYYDRNHLDLIVVACVDVGKYMTIPPALINSRDKHDLRRKLDRIKWMFC